MGQNPKPRILPPLLNSLQGMESQDCENPLQNFWEQELQRERDNPTYLFFLLNSLKALESAEHVTCVGRSTYQEWCLQVNPKKFNKFKDTLYDKRGVASRVICKDGVFLERATSAVCMPDHFVRDGVPLSKLGASTIAIHSRADLTEEQKEEQVDEVLTKEQVANRTGNHYRNHYIRASNPYGHDWSEEIYRAPLRQGGMEVGAAS